MGEKICADGARTIHKKDRQSYKRLIYRIFIMSIDVDKSGDENLRCKKLRISASFAAKPSGNCDSRVKFAAKNGIAA